ncbi:MAG: hypothetical protein LBC59_03060 [Chitinispirillales bacterium]|nr:hypothetical protein [Chitinispirillales bacterium]
MKRLTFLLILTLFAGISMAGMKYVAVVETGVDERSDASSMLNSAEMALITAELRRVAVENLPRDKYNVMTSETVQSMGGAVLEECAEENCVITLGSRIGADYIVRGTISKFQSMLTLSVEMYETDNGTLVASSSHIRSERPLELLGMISVLCGNMFRKFVNGQTLIRQNTAGQYVAAQKTEKNELTGSYTTNKYNSLESQYKDFSTGRRWGTWALNLFPIGLGSFVLMEDYVGGGILFGLSAVGSMCIGGSLRDSTYINTIGVYTVLGGQIFNIIRSRTYHKPKPKSAPVNANANNFKPYDGLKLTILPTGSGDYKVYARYDYTF